MNWNPDCGIFSCKNCKSAQNFSKTATKQNELIEMQDINSNYTVSESNSHCHAVEDRCTGAAKAITDLAPMSLQWM